MEVQVPPGRSTEALVHGHRRRVAALALETASSLGLPPADKQSLEEAALSHHCLPGFLESEALDRLGTDLGVRYPADPPPPTKDPGGSCQTLLEALRRRPARSHDERVSRLVEILELADFFDQRLQFLPYERMVPEQILDELHWLAQEGFYRAGIVGALAGLARVRKEELLERVNRLPVFPAVALRALELVFQPDSSLFQIEKLVSADQVLAGQIIKVANSSLYSPGSRISTIRQALAHLGLEASFRVVAGTVFQPLFVSANLHGLWRHSLDICQLAERLARHSGRVRAEEAYLAGLVHDVGRLALQKCAREDVIAYTRLLEGGCEPVFAEAVLCGFDHGVGGGDVLRLWSFPEHLIVAVENHHQPEHSDSELAAILYLAEFWSGSDEDLPSWARLHSALERAGIPFGLLHTLPSPRPGLLEAADRLGPQAGARPSPAEGLSR